MIVMIQFKSSLHWEKSWGLAFHYDSSWSTKKWQKKETMWNYSRQALTLSLWDSANCGYAHFWQRSKWWHIARELETLTVKSKEMSCDYVCAVMSAWIWIQTWVQTSPLFMCWFVLWSDTKHLVPRWGNSDLKEREELDFVWFSFF